MHVRLWFLQSVSWRRFCGSVCGWIAKRSPDLGYAFGYHIGLAFSMMAWSAKEHRWEAFYAVRDEMRRRRYRLPA